MKISSEAKIGMIGLVTLAVLIWGINYLKGRNILSSTYTLITHFKEVRGLESSAPVVMNGIKIGYVHQLQLTPGQDPPVKVLLRVEKDYPLHEGTVAVLASADLLGTSVIRMESSGMSGRLLAHRDTLPASVEKDLVAEFREQLTPVLDKVSELSTSVASLTGRIDTLVSSGEIEELIRHLSSSARSLSASLSPEGSLDQSFRNLETVTGVLASREEEISSLMEQMESITASLDSSGLGELPVVLNSVAEQLDGLLKQVNSGEGSLGALVYSDSLMTGLQGLIAGLDSLAVDLRENPGNYVQFSIFGNR